VLDKRWRAEFERGLKPVGTGLAKSGLSPDLLTATGLVFAAATAVAVGVGQLRWGLVLLALSALPDLLDGAVAKASGRASARGAFFDSVADRVADGLVLGGVAWHLSVTEGGGWPVLAYAVAGLSLLVSYERARAESLGFSGKGGLMERAERIILLGLAFLVPAYLIPILWVMLVLTAATAVQRFVLVWRQATPRVPRDRWMTWRELRDLASATPSFRRGLDGAAPHRPALRPRRERRRPPVH
jgi:CDP-diacylglycerol---glycerol-3-phosphate 3-phosphatidyltransferase